MNNELYLEINKKLKEYALAIPPLITGQDIQEIDSLMRSNPGATAIESKILSLVVSPYLRASIFKSRLKFIPEFNELNYLIDHSHLAFYRGNNAGALFTIIPIIEGMLRRWDENVSAKPWDGKDIRKWSSEFITATFERNPNHPKFRINLVQSWVSACVDIFKYHFFQGNEFEYFGDFNRHKLLHHLMRLDYKQNSTNLLKRAYLLMDLIIEIYISEKNLPLSMLSGLSNDDARFIAYKNAINQRMEYSPELVIDNLYI